MDDFERIKDSWNEITVLELFVNQPTTGNALFHNIYTTYIYYNVCAPIGLSDHNVFVYIPSKS